MYLDENIARYDEAVKLFSQAIEANPNFVYSVCNRGVAYEYLGEYDNKTVEFTYDGAYLRGSDRVVIAIDSSKSYISKDAKQLEEKW